MSESKSQPTQPAMAAAREEWLRDQLLDLSNASFDCGEHKNAGSHEYTALMEKQMTAKRAIFNEFDALRAELAAAKEERDALNKELEAVLSMGQSVRVREGGGPENLAASIAVTLAQLRAELAAKGEALETLIATAKNLEQEATTKRKFHESQGNAVDAAYQEGKETAYSMIPALAHTANKGEK